MAESVVAARRLRLPINHAPTPVWLCSSGWIRLAWDVAACGSVCQLGMGLTALLLRRLVAEMHLWLSRMQLGAAPWIGRLRSF